MTGSRHLKMCAPLLHFWGPAGSWVRWSLSLPSLSPTSVVPPSLSEQQRRPAAGTECAKACFSTQTRLLSSGTPEGEVPTGYLLPWSQVSPLPPRKGLGLPAQSSRCFPVGAAGLGLLVCRACGHCRREVQVTGVPERKLSVSGGRRALQAV